MIYWVMSVDLNEYEMMFGGKLFVMVDVEVFLVVVWLVWGMVVIVSMDYVQFIWFFVLGDVVEFQVFVIGIGKWLIEVFVKVIVEEMVIGKCIFGFLCFMIYVVIDEVVNFIDYCLIGEDDE